MSEAGQHTTLKNQSAVRDESLMPPGQIILAVQVLAGITLAIAFTAAVGWITDNPALSAFGESFYPMAPRTILVFLCFGIALYVMTSVTAQSNRFAQMLSLFGIGLAASRLVEHSMGIADGFIEQFLSPSLNSVLPVPPGRMALATAICFIFGGTGIILLTRTKAIKWKRHLSTGLAIAMIAIPLVFLLGYAYRAPLDYQGIAIPMALNTSLAFTALGLGILLLAIGYEISERRKSIATTSFLASLVKSSNDAIICISPEEIITVWSDSAEQMFGYTAQEAVGQSWKLISHAQTFEDQRGTLHYLKRGQVIQNLEVVLRHKNGYPLDIEVSAFPLIDEDGKVYAITGFHRDISARKQHERERLITQARLQAIMDNTPAVVFLKDIDGKYLVVNRRFEELLGVEPGSMLGKADSDFFPKDYAERFRYRDQLVISAGASMQFEEVFHQADGEHYYLANIFALVDSSGRSYGIGGIVTEITERKKAEEQISLLNFTLTRQTEELEATNKELESFSYTVSHDLRAPLRAITGFSQVIQEDHSSQLDEKGQDFFKRIKKAADDMGILIDDILSLSRVTRREMQVAPVNLSELAEEVIAGLRKAQPSRYVDVIIAPSLQVTGDRHLLRIVLENLLNNAWKYSGKREHAEIVLDVTRKENELIFFVRDNGAGFDMQYAGKLFGAFQRLHHAGEFEGTGIGLATVQRIIRRHGGKVWAEAAVDKGAVFYFTLPHSEATAHVEAANITR